MAESGLQIPSLTTMLPSLTRQMFQKLERRILQRDSLTFVSNRTSNHRAWKRGAAAMEEGMSGHPELGWSWQRNESWELIDPHLLWSLSCLLTPRPALPLAYIHMCLLHRLEDRDALPRMWPETYHGHRLPAAEGRAQEPWPRRRTTWVPTLTLPLRCCVTGQLHLLSVPQFPSV